MDRDSLGESCRLMDEPQHKPVTICAEPVAHYVSKVMVDGWQCSIMTMAIGVSTKFFYIVSTGMGDFLHAGVPNHPGQLSLAIPPWVGVMSTGDGFGHC